MVDPIEFIVLHGRQVLPERAVSEALEALERIRALHRKAHPHLVGMVVPPDAPADDDDFRGS